MYVQGDSMVLPVYYLSQYILATPFEFIFTKMAHGFPYNSIEEALPHIHYFVEADSFAMHALWATYSQHPIYTKISIPWSEISSVFMTTIPGGTSVSFAFAYIFDKLVCFYYPTSMKIDWNDIHAYLLPYYARGKHCNAENFHQCILACEK